MEVTFHSLAHVQKTKTARFTAAYQSGLLLPTCFSWMVFINKDAMSDLRLEGKVFCTMIKGL